MLLLAQNSIEMYTRVLATILSSFFVDILRFYNFIAAKVRWDGDFLVKFTSFSKDNMPVSKFTIFLLVMAIFLYVLVLICIISTKNNLIR